MGDTHNIPISKCSLLVQSFREHSELENFKIDWKELNLGLSIDEVDDPITLLSSELTKHFTLQNLKVSVTQNGMVEVVR